MKANKNFDYIVDMDNLVTLTMLVFEGDEPCSATAYAFTPNGTEYAVCTTIQYGFKQPAMPHG